MGRPAARGVTSPFALVLMALALVAGLSAAPIVPAVAQETAEAVANANVRVVYATPGAPDVDVLLDGQALLQGLATETVSDYLPITPQEHRLQIVPTGQSAAAALVDETIDAAPGQTYLLAVYGLLNDINGAVYEVDLSEIEPGNARVRLINLSPDAGAIDLLETGGDEWFGDVDLGEAADYRDIAPGIYSADLRGQEDRILRTIDDLDFAETRVYDIIALGQVYDDSLRVQVLETTVSPPCSEVLGLTAASSDACVRVVHAAQDAPAIDFYVNEARVAEGLEFGTATEYAPIPSGGDRGIRVVASGGAAEDSLLDTSLDFDPGQGYEIMVTGTGEDLDILITGTDLRPVAAGQARLRIVHAAPDAGPIDIGLTGSEENLFEGVNFGDATHYIIVDAGDYPIEVRPGGEDMTVALQSEATLEEGTTYDLVALGSPADQTLALLVLTARVPIQTGEIATPDAVMDEAPLAATVPPQTIDNAAATATPGS